MLTWAVAWWYNKEAEHGFKWHEERNAHGFLMFSAIIGDTIIFGGLLATIIMELIK